MEAVARRTDPQSSKDAANRMNEGKLTATNEDIVLETLRNHPFSTYRELAIHIPNFDRTEVMRRLCSLRDERPQRVDNGLPRKSTVGRGVMQTWYCTDGQRPHGWGQEVSNV